MNNMEESLKPSNGITLISLVITIIVLLILAGISIQMLSGNNGILSRAGEAKERTERSEIIEKARLEIIRGITDNNGKNLDEDGIIDVLTVFFKEDSIPADLTDMTAILTTKDEKFNDITLGELIGDVKVAEESPTLKATKDNTEVKLSTVSDSEISSYYGSETNYKSISHPNIIWQLFYSDTSNYYLIASDYVPNAELPCEGNDGFGETDLSKVDGSDYKAKFASSSSYNDYVMTTTTEYRKGSQANMLKAGSSNRNPLVGTYLRWVDSYPDSSNVNISAVAYMMDTKKWSSFADGAGALYAIGGPTIEMLSLSWNAVPGHTQMTKYEGDNITSNINDKGYIAQSPETGSGFFGTSTNMWVVNNSKANGYWLASPSSMGASRVRYVHSNGNINNNFANASLSNGGFRPIVVVSKS